jgi:hypothetical protein
MVGPAGWTTRINDRHEVEWIPPPHLDSGQARINDYHQPEKLHPPPDDAWTPDDPLATDESATNGDNTTHESGGPEPPGGKAA